MNEVTEPLADSNAVVKANCNTIQRAINAMNQVMNESGSKNSITHGDNLPPIQEATKNYGDNAGFQKAMVEMIQGALKLRDAVRNIEVTSDGQTARTITAQRRIRRAKNWDDWVTWAHSTVRWVIGVVLVVTLYTFFVNLSELFPWIHIPVRDWILNH